ncbi:drug resistance transporter, EmrB/QacA subfamily [Solidesulfovibrio fructosivorans JJ]]|uniref:Drug resistance transporter, EmrB/QacA subfamily n=1 Tax=Solidesulfovibrio fructosivorans JJ] TaxID=596151 RepID=E1K0V8_SOLFR|nr:MFS transporter [Solidesulfovibrio fructosivorans]EFL49723.1 drug resistance transporter, EmrB/QacA subfamily [Solidesulfovibrio fructosivorans JJ]]
MHVFDHGSGAPGPQPVTTAHSPALAMLGVNLMVFMATLDMSIVNVALPTLVKALHTDFAVIQWVILSYVLVIASLLLLVSRLGDMHDKKRIFSTGLLLFVGASLCCGLAPSVHWLIAFRAAQGIGAAMSQSLGMAIVTQISPPSSRGRALGLIGGTVAMGLMLGPPLGGVLIGFAGWRSMFLLNVPIGIAALFVVHRFMPFLPPIKEGERFDIPGAITASLTLGSYCLGMTLTQRNGFSDPTAMGLLGVALAGLVLFLAIERRAKAPMLDLSLFANPFISLGLAMSVLVFITGASGFIMPFFLQSAQGRTVMEMGLMMMILPFSMALTAPIAGSLADRYGSCLIRIIGLSILWCGTMALGGLTVTTPWWGYMLRSMPVGLGIGIFQAPNNSAIMGEMPPHRLGVGSGLANYARVFGQSTGLPLVGTVFTSLVLTSGHVGPRMELTSAPPDVLAAGVAGVFRWLAGLLLVAIGLGALTWLLTARRNHAQRG